MTLVDVAQIVVDLALFLLALFVLPPLILAALVLGDPDELQRAAPQ